MKRNTQLSVDAIEITPQKKEKHRIRGLSFEELRKFKKNDIEKI